MDFPKKYRFIGVQIFMSADKEKIKRKMYGMGELIGSVANFYVMSHIILTIIIMNFAKQGIEAEITSRVFKDSLKNMGPDQKKKRIDTPKEYWADNSEKLFK